MQIGDRVRLTESGVEALRAGLSVEESREYRFRTGMLGTIIRFEGPPLVPVGMPPLPVVAFDGIVIDGAGQGAGWVLGPEYLEVSPGTRTL